MNEFNEKNAKVKKWGETDEHVLNAILFACRKRFEFWKQPLVLVWYFADILSVVDKQIFD